MGAYRADAEKVYQRWHWGLPCEQVIEWNDSALPHNMELVQIGELAELHIDHGDGKSVEYKIPEKEWRDNHVVFDLRHPANRIYLLLARHTMDSVKRLFSNKGPNISTSLTALAKAVGGRQSNYPYPNVMVSPLGTLTHLAYHTKKKGDYEADNFKKCIDIHEMGEEGGIPPVIAMDRDGRLWICGGSYTCPTPGITR